MPTVARHASTSPVLLLVGGPAGPGKSTVSAAWCHTRSRAVRLDLDEVRNLIVARRADPQVRSPLQALQYDTSVKACVALARVFLADGYDVAIETAFEPDDFTRRWQPLLAGLAWRLVVLRPSLPITLTRSHSRNKRVLEEHTRTQHAATGGWSGEIQVDTTELSVGRTVEVINDRLRST
jgi:predicted kinase